ncbi:MAG: hypothetical protein HW421_2569 [Ignavibacteria bacterium]|nr:hypothetical protein [Ignavibacteria bacterium]
MKSLLEIKDHLMEGDYFHSLHSATRVIERNISFKDISEADGNAQIIEDYPDDKYSPSCLLLGFTKKGIPLHIQVTRTIGKKRKIITIYHPDEKFWSDNFKERI